MKSKRNKVIRDRRTGLYFKRSTRAHKGKWVESPEDATWYIIVQNYAICIGWDEKSKKYEINPNLEVVTFDVTINKEV